jgi:hypothetical protein
VIDASGCLRTPNPLGAAGIPAIGGRELADRVSYGLPDVRADPGRYAGKHVLVVGSGHSHPEQGFYIAGVKSYGCANTFLLKTGYEQVRSIAAGLQAQRTAEQADLRRSVPRALA